MSKLSFFDCNCMVGRYSKPEPGSLFTAEEIEEELEYCGVDEALVFHALAKEYSPSIGNARLIGEIEGKKIFHPCWVLLPHHTGEMPKPTKILEEMARNGVKAARVFPAVSVQNFSTDEWTCGELFDAMEGRRIPLFLDLDQTDWRTIHDICDRRRDLPLVITNVNYRINRKLYPLLENFDNLYVEISGYQGHRMIEDTCRLFGAGRLLFGSRMPFFTPAPSVMMVRYANISDDERRMIAGENLRRMLSEVRL